MDVILVNPPSRYAGKVVRDTLYGCWCKGRANYVWPPTGLMYLAAILEKDGYKVGIFDSQVEEYFDISDFNSEYVVINTATITFAEDLEFIKMLKENLDVKTILVGTHVTVFPKETLKYKEVDYIVIGEPDFALRDLINCLENGNNLKEIRGIGFKKNEKIFVTSARKPIENLDELPFPARRLIDHSKYFNPLAEREPFTTALSSRGCPARCVYCTAPVLYGRRYRFRSAENVVDELELIENMGFKEVFFRDESFTVNKKRVLKICELIKRRNIEISWMCNSRVDAINDEIARAMKSAGCHTIKFGVESGVQEILNNLKKGITLKQTKRAFEITKKHGIKRVAHFMLGSPGETKETLEKTIKFVIYDLDADYISPNITTPYPGTELWNMVLESGYQLNTDFRKWNLSDSLERAVFNEIFCNVNKEDLERAFKMAYLNFYLRPSYILKKLKTAKSPRDLAKYTKAGISLLRNVL